MWPNLLFPADLVTFTEEIFNGKLHFCAVLSLVVVSTKCQKSVKKAVTCVARGDILEENSALEIYIEGMMPKNCQLFVDEINRGALVKPSDLVYPIYALILIYR